MNFFVLSKLKQAGPDCAKQILRGTDAEVPFCAYAYVISRRGAAKITATINTVGGISLPADHMITNLLDADKLFVMDPFVAGSLQDHDPEYAQDHPYLFLRVTCRHHY